MMIARADTMSEEIDQLAGALALAQGEFKSVPTTQTATVKGKAKQSGRDYEYSYRYAALSDVFEACRPGLSKNGLAVSQLVTEREKGLQIESLLMHSSGQWLRSVFHLKATDDPQDLGGQITYYRRYALSALVGLATEEDQDAQHSGSGRQQAQQQAQQPQQQGRPGNGHQTRKQPPPAGQQTREQWLAECKAVFLRLPKEQQAQLLGKFSAGSLEAVSAANQERFKNALIDLAAAASG